MNPENDFKWLHVIANLDAVQNAAIASVRILGVYQNMVARAAQTSLLN